MPTLIATESMLKARELSVPPEQAWQVRPVTGRDVATCTTTVTALGKAPTHVKHPLCRREHENPEPVRHPLGECADPGHSRGHPLPPRGVPRSPLIRHGLLDPSTIDGLRQALTCSSGSAPPCCRRPGAVLAGPALRR